jgi:hypothetical protein
MDTLFLLVVDDRKLAVGQSSRLRITVQSACQRTGIVGASLRRKRGSALDTRYARTWRGLVKMSEEHAGKAYRDAAILACRATCGPLGHKPPGPVKEPEPEPHGRAPMEAPERPDPPDSPGPLKPSGR